MRPRVDVVGAEADRVQIASMKIHEIRNSLKIPPDNIASRQILDAEQAPLILVNGNTSFLHVPLLGPPSVVGVKATSHVHVPAENVARVAAARHGLAPEQKFALVEDGRADVVARVVPQTSGSFRLVHAVLLHLRAKILDALGPDRAPADVVRRVAQLVGHGVDLADEDEPSGDYRPNIAVLAKERPERSFQLAARDVGDQPARDGDEGRAVRALADDGQVLDRPVVDRDVLRPQDVRRGVVDV
mmetsp:Transcript_35174/g.109007  ORF Transcript_35174/g.109007 Transcript_35174/m.109007 type:complete len:244 (-) Transcript_35174:503-1234(-)